MERESLELELVDVHTVSGGREAQRMQSNLCTSQNLCDMVKLFVEKGKKHRAFSNDYRLHLSCREVCSGMSFALTVRTSRHIVIAFPEKFERISPARALPYLLAEAAKENMRGMEDLETAVEHGFKAWAPKGRKLTPGELALQKKRWYDKELKKRRVRMDEMSTGITASVEYHKRLYGFHPDLNAPPGVKRLRQFPFLIVFCKDPEMHDLLATTLYRRSEISDSAIHGWRQAEVDANLALQFFETTNIRPGERFRVDPKYLTFPDDHQFTTDMEAEMTFDPSIFRDRHTMDRKTREIKIEKSEAEMPFKPIPRDPDVAQQPRRVLCIFDLECVTTRKGGFPQHSRKEDAIICCSMVFYDSATKQITGYVLALSGVSRTKTKLEEDHDLDFQLVMCPDEKALLETFRDLLVVQHDADDVSGWNTEGFDNPYITGRHKVLGLQNGTSRATFLSKFIHKSCKFKTTSTTSSAHGTRESIKPDTPMVTWFDMMVLIKKRYKFEEYNLKTVSQKLLNSTKIDMPAEQIFENWLSEDPERRRWVVAYCYKDGVLPLQVWDKLLLDSQTAALASVCSVTYSDVLNRGELWKAYSLMYIFAHERGYMLNEDPSYTKAPTWAISREQEEEQEKYVADAEKEKKKVEKKLDKVRAKIKDGKKGVGTDAQAIDDLHAQRKELSNHLDRCRRKVKRAKKGETRAEAKEFEARFRRYVERKLNAAEWDAEHGADERIEDAEDSDNDEDDEEFEIDGKRYKGATVMEALAGLYGRVATCDFEALYPSIIKESNICPSTMATKEKYEALKETWNFRVISLGDGEKAYVAQDIRGILPAIVDTLLTERKKAKKKKAAAGREAKRVKDLMDAMEDKESEEYAPLVEELQKWKELYNIYDAAQLALKIVCNSQYGAIGAPQSSAKYACVIGARAVTGRGRELLEATKAWIEEHFPELKVIYGDTDSVMVSYDNYFLELRGDPAARDRAIFKHAAKMCEDLTEFFGDPINLEFEKVFCGYLLISKKRYFGYKRTSLDEDPEMDSKGVSSVRRSSIPLLRRLYNEVQELLFQVAESEDYEVMYEHLLKELQRLASDECDIDELTRTCQLAASYANPQPQSVLCEKIARNGKKYRKPAPRVGDRVPFCMRRLKPKSKTYEMAEDPDYMKRHNVPAATHYFAKALRTPLEQLLEVSGRFDMNRINLLFDQAVDICTLRAKGIDPTVVGGGEGATIVDYKDPKKAPKSKAQQKEDRKRKMVEREERKKKKAEQEKKQAGAMAKFLVPKEKKRKREDSKKKKKSTKKKKAKKELTGKAAFYKAASKRRKAEKLARLERQQKRGEDLVKLQNFFRRSQEIRGNRKASPSPSSGSKRKRPSSASESESDSGKRVKPEQSQ